MIRDALNQSSRQLLGWLAILATLAVLLVLTSVLRDTFRQAIPALEWAEAYTFGSAQPDAPTPKNPTVRSDSDDRPGRLILAYSSEPISAEGASLPLMAAQDHYLLPHTPSEPHVRLVWPPNLARAPPVFL